MSAPTLNSTEAQRARILGWLRTNPLTTLQARSQLDVMHPAARVMELRAEGHEIFTLHSREYSDCGELHLVARYVLLPNGAPVADRFHAKRGRKDRVK